MKHLKKLASRAVWGFFQPTLSSGQVERLTPFGASHGLVVPHSTLVPWATPEPAAAAATGPGGLSTRSRCGTGLRATRKQQEGCSQKQPKPRNHRPPELCRPEEQRSPSPCSVLLRRRVSAVTAAPLTRQEDEHTEVAAPPLLLPVGVATPGRAGFPASPRLGAFLTEPPSRHRPRPPPALRLRRLRRHYAPRRTPASLCEWRVADRRRWRGLDEESKDGSVDD